MAHEIIIIIIVIALMLIVFSLGIIFSIGKLRTPEEIEYEDKEQAQYLKEWSEYNKELKRVQNEIRLDNMINKVNNNSINGELK